MPALRVTRSIQTPTSFSAAMASCWATTQKSLSSIAMAASGPINRHPSTPSRSRARRRSSLRNPLGADTTLLTPSWMIADAPGKSTGAIEVSTMPKPIRGADLVARTLDAAGLRTTFTLSGNHIMPLFDAALGTRLRLIHVRHEAAAVHMADAWGRLTGQCGIVWVSGGAGFTNAAAALTTAQAGESPLILLSGHAGLKEIGRGAFQELRQAEMAAPVAKASWTARSTASLGSDLAKAVRIATSGRHGPVHLSLPFDVLAGKVEEAPSLWPPSSAFGAPAQALEAGAADAVLGELGKAERPLILAGPQLCHSGDLSLIAMLEGTLGVPVVAMESPRGVNDPRLGAF